MAYQQSFSRSSSGRGSMASLILLLFFSAFNSVLPAYLSSALSTGQGSFFIH